MMEKILQGSILTGGTRSALLDAAWERAQLALCEHPRQGRPCGECAHCRKAARRIHPDVTLIERLTDREGRLRRELVVEQIRALERDAVVLPNEAARKVYIFPEAELLNTAAQNAFLKLLEEPPSFVVFLLCAENLSPLLPTVRSRCAIFRLGGEIEGGESVYRPAAESYLRALGDEAALLRCGSELEKLSASEFRDFLAQLRVTAAELLTGRELLALERELEHLGEMLKVNVSVRHGVGLLCTYRYEDAPER